MEKELWDIFKNVNFWLEYAEKKNGYILTWIAVQYTLIQLFKFEIKGVLLVSIICFALSFLICIINFFPITKISSILYRLSQSCEKPSETDNLIFYGHIVKYSIEQYIENMEKYLNISIKNNKYLSNLCGQIVINSGIADGKFIILKICFWFFAVGQILFLWHLLF